MRLLVTEKPDAARELAGYLSRKSGAPAVKKQRYIEIGQDIVTWARGHLLGQATPDFYLLQKGVVMTPQNSKKGKLYWSPEHLPIIPAVFAYEPSEEDKDRTAQLNEIGDLMKRADIIFNAADRDREGQLIFDEIADYFHITGKKPIKRVMFSALDDASFDRSFSMVMENSDPAVRNPGLAAKARGQADWLIGMNGTRAMTLAHTNKEFGVMNVGRVMEPTFSIVVLRQLEIDSFVSKPFYTPVIKLADGTVLQWHKRRDGGDMVGFDADGRIVDRAVAEAIVSKINAGLAGEIYESKSIEKSQDPPLPFSLPAIQSELSKKHGLPVSSITEACQKLYEKKMQSYVGTDCRYLPESMHSEARDVLVGLQSKFPGIVGGANTGKKYSCWNDKKLNGDGAAAHHAIIPTGKVGALDSEVERIVFDAVCRRYIAQFHPEYRYMSIALKSVFGHDEFTASAHVPVSMGWKEVEGDDDSKEEESDALGNKDKNNLKR